MIYILNHSKKMIDKESMAFLLNLNDEDFVYEAYSRILKREARPAEVDYWLKQLKQGATRETVLFELRISEEGIRINVPFSGFCVQSILLTELMNMDDEAFVEAAYISVLGRSSDNEGKNHYIDGLRRHMFNRIDIIYGMRDSKEGQGNTVDIVGLDNVNIRRKVKKIIYKIPVIGRTTENIMDLVYLSQQYEQRIRKCEERIKQLENATEELYKVNKDINEAGLSLNQVKVYHMLNGEI